VETVRTGLLQFLARACDAGEQVAAYGAAAKGNTLLNFCGVTSNEISFVADVSPHKQDKLLPGSRIPVLAPNALRARQPDHVLILPWNLKAEITAAHGYVREWGGDFVIAVPELTVLP
ncbi:MAG: SAM-dependent methyltransferase, partial [Alphaproteobacteria bacterium]|nr:SAM-dependent methyltransferase [Alphaproteobacteria bacterium]